MIYEYNIAAPSPYRTSSLLSSHGQSLRANRLFFANYNRISPSLHKIHVNKKNEKRENIYIPIIFWTTCKMYGLLTVTWTDYNQNLFFFKLIEDDVIFRFSNTKKMEIGDYHTVFTCMFQVLIYHIHFTRVWFH